MYTEIFIKILGGAGLFFAGIYLFTGHVRNISGIYLRKYVGKYTDNGLSSFLLGLLAGAISTSAKFVTFTSAGFVLSGVINMRTARFIAVGSSIGTISLILGASFDISKLALFIVGVSGIALQFFSSRSARIKTISNIMIGFGLLFIGIEYMKEGAVGLKDAQFLTDFINSADKFLIYAFITSFVIAILTQSEAAAAVFGIALIDAGMLNIHQTVIYVCGANNGVGIAMIILSVGFKGRVRQMITLNALLRIIGSFVFMPLLYLETQSQIPVIKSVLITQAVTLQEKIVILFFTYKVTSAFIWYVFNGSFTSLITRFIPLTTEEDYSKLNYIHSLNLSDITSATELIQKEQLALFKRSAYYLDTVRDDVPGDKKIECDALHKACGTVKAEIDYYITDMLRSNLTRQQSEYLLYLHSLQQLTGSLQNNLYDFVRSIVEIKKSGLVNTFCQTFSEAIHAAVLIAGDVIESMDENDIEILKKITQDKGEVVDRIKKNYLVETFKIPAEHQNSLLELLVYYERIEWLLNRIAVVSASFVESSNTNEQTS